LRQTSPFLSPNGSTGQYPPTAICRYFSAGKGSGEEKANNNVEENAANEKEVPATIEDKLKEELEWKDKEIIDLKDKYLRSVADFRNLQERTKRDIESARTFAIQRFATDLLESVDNFERALSVVPAEKLSAALAENNKDLHDLFQGLKMTENILMAALKKHGLERFDPGEPTEDGKSQKFDPQLHEATFMAKAEDKQDGDIMHTQSKGFSLNGRVLRAAKVGVVKNS
jgi:molecular chaperone GrpE